LVHGCHANGKRLEFKTKRRGPKPCAGLANAPRAFIGLFRGENIGQELVKV
jgi:NADPH-dependent curcumin reductase CurA